MPNRPFYKLYCWQALSTFGESMQFDMAVEELAELAVAVQHYKRGRENARENVIEEMADVGLVLDQLREILLITGDEIEKVRHKKLLRLMVRVDLKSTTLPLEIDNGNRDDI